MTETSLRQQSPAAGDGEQARQMLLSLGVLRPAEVDRICAEDAKTQFIIEDMLPAKSIAIVAGDSAIGKSPLICQLALCVAGGIPFLGKKTDQAAYCTSIWKTLCLIAKECGMPLWSISALARRRRISC